jgi:hypothetical protein
MNHHQKKLLTFLIREELSSMKDISKPYNQSLFDDDSFNDDSVYVPQDIKDVILAWSKKMMLR